MALNVNLPDDSTLISKLDDFERETRKYVMNFQASLAGNSFNLVTKVITKNSLNCLSSYIDPQYADLGNVNLEFIIAEATAPVDLYSINYGYEGQIKVFILNTNYITFVKSGSVEAYFDLNSPDNLESNIGDIIAFVNIGGDGGNESHGYWRELIRILKY